MDAGSLKLIHRLISMGSSSLLQYVSEASPWSAGASQTALDQVVALAHTERGEVTGLVRLLQKKHLGLPLTGSFPSHYTTMNFVTLDYLLPRLIADHQKELAEIESQLHQVDDEEIRKLIHSHIDMKRGHLETLQALAASRRPAGAA